MLARLPAVRAKELLKALGKAGFEIIRQNGSHVTLHNFDTETTTVVPVHPGEFPRWLLKKIIKDAGLAESISAPPLSYSAPAIHWEICPLSSLLSRFHIA